MALPGEPTEHQFLELCTIRLALETFAPLVDKRDMLIYMDNMTVRVFVSRWVGIGPGLYRRRLAGCSPGQRSSSPAEHILGIDNVMADWLSRKELNQSEWRLHPHVFKELNRRFGPFTMDLFACHQNHQLPRWKGWTPCTICSPGEYSMLLHP